MTSGLTPATCPTCARALPADSSSRDAGVDSADNANDGRHPTPTPTLTSTTLVAADDDPDVIAVDENSKREYLLAQIRQKDSIIESLLKQVSLTFFLFSFFLFFWIGALTSAGECSPCPRCTVE